MNTRAFLTYEDLKEMSGYANPSAAQVAAWLQSEKIPYGTGARGKPYTTIDAVNKALGVVPGAQDESKPTIKIKSLLEPEKA